MKHRDLRASNIVEADLLLSDKKLPRIQVAGSLVLGIAYLSLPVALVVVTVYLMARHESLGFDPIINIILFVGASAVAGLFGFAGYRLIRRALQ